MDEVVPHADDLASVITKALEKVEEQNLEVKAAIFPHLAMLGLAHCREFMQDESHMKDIMAVLDGLWKLGTQVDALYKHPRTIALILAIEADIHRLQSDYEALRRTNKLLWNILKRYDWLDEQEWMPRLRNDLAFSMANSFSADPDCDATKYLLEDCVRYYRILSLKARESDKNRQVAGQELSAFLSKSLSIYYYQKLIFRSPCAPLFKFAARDIYDTIYAIEPRSLPHWPDLKLTIRKRVEADLNKVRNESAQAETLDPTNSLSDVMGKLEETPKQEPVDSKFAPSDLLMKTPTPAL